MGEPKRAYSCSFRGLRPEQLPAPEEVIKRVAEYAIQKAISEGYKVFITIPDPGFETWSAEIVLKLRETNPQIKLECFLPYEGYQNKYRKAQREEVNEILQKADKITYQDKLKEKTRYSIYRAHTELMFRTSLAILYYDQRGHGYVADFTYRCLRIPKWDVYNITSDANNIDRVEQYGELLQKEC